VDFTVSQNQENVVHFILNLGLHVGDDLLKDRSEESRSEEADTWEVGSVKREDVINGLDFRVGIVSIQRETMVYSVFSNESGDTSESVYGEGFVRVVALKDGAYLFNSMLILVVSTEVMKGTCLSILSI
jgi:hypothetical protein